MGIVRQGDQIRLRAEPAVGVVGGHVALVLRPVLLVHVAEISELTALRIVAHHPAVGVGDRPDAAVVVLRHTHRHAGDRLLREGERPLLRIELGEILVEVGVKSIAAGQNRGEGTVALLGKGHGEFLALPGLSIDHQQGVTPTMVE